MHLKLPIRFLLRSKACFIAALAISLFFSVCNTAAASHKPNIVFILADDLGYMDIGANNLKTFYETPNLNRLAVQGMRFTEGYAACPVCSPTRASILTGKYPARLQLTDYIGGNRTGKLLPADYLDHLPLEEVTLAEALKKGGYITGMFGKWHLGTNTFLPEAQGFDVNVGGSGAGHPSSYFSPYHNPKLADGPKGEYLNDRLTEEALRFINANKKHPFFLYFAHYAVHTPLQAKKEVIEKYETKAAALPPLNGPRVLPEGEQQVRQVQDHPVYAAMVQSLDESIGRILKKLDELGLTKNTVVIFFSDNGGLSTTEGMPTSNVPLRAGKGWLYEGGIREPLLIKWPGKIKAGVVCSTPVISTDFYPTILAMAGMRALPEQHCDGVNLLPLLKGGKAPDRKALFWHYPHYGNQGGQPGCAVRAGDWKLIRFFEDNHSELYNLKEDLSEKHDLLSQMPGKAQELNVLLDQFLRDTRATLPKANPNFKSPSRKQPSPEPKPGRQSIKSTV
jgi:arylsulfatase A-like enzyme